MEVKGRECEEVLIGEYKMYFLTEFKGREYRLTMEAQEDALGSDFDVVRFTINVPSLFPIFCMKCTKGEEEMKIEAELLDELSVEDFVKVQGKLSSLARQLFELKKK